ncbi:amidohydrolase family protein [Salidesulfovibrio onnuriiensis]|uniref:amidohydrolase family protein n=1 Tax=Salidesulfovibrio onnuriiensis TaxID=2583823 RepID=UPI0011C96EFF|nr:amidohydrolase family protein [Salidesulfovibrio onnuriiensis]
MRFDVHTHSFHPKVAAKVIESLYDHYGIQSVGTGMTDDLLARIKTAGLDRAVVHSAATDPSQVIPANNWAIQLQQTHPELIAFGSMHVDFENIEAELDRIAAKGIKGLKFHNDFQGFRMDDPRFHSLMEIIGDRFVLMFHVGSSLPPEENPSCPVKMARLAELFPKATMIAAHMGGYRYWDLACEYLAGIDVYVDTSSSLPFLSREQFLRFYNKHDRQKILFGSDYPIFDPEDTLNLLREKIGLDHEQIEELLTNANRLFA